MTATGIQPAFNTDAITFTFEQRVRPRRKIEVQYGYSIERNHTFEVHPDPLNPIPFDIEVTKANLMSGVVLDMRNDVFDATARLVPCDELRIRARLARTRPASRANAHATEVLPPCS